MALLFIANIIATSSRLCSSSQIAQKSAWFLLYICAQKSAGIAIYGRHKNQPRDLPEDELALFRIIRNERHHDDQKDVNEIAEFLREISKML